MENVRYPIGKFEMVDDIRDDVLEKWIRDIELLPRTLQEVTKNLTEEQLRTPYRSGGWTIKQVIHHLADSHMNAYIRLKLALTEDSPVVKTYDENKWSVQKDYEMSIQSSFAIIDGTHSRWCYLLRHLSSSDFNKTFHHPDLGKTTILSNVGMYAWHGRHHLAHITNLLKQKGWL